MTSRGVIADTSVWISFFRGKGPGEKELAALIEDGQVVTTGIILAELLQGVKNPEEGARIIEAMSAIPALEMTTTLWIKAGNLSAGLRRKGVTIPLSDIAIAVLAMTGNAEILTFDKHFEGIPGVKLYGQKGKSAYGSVPR